MYEPVSEQQPCTGLGGGRSRAAAAAAAEVDPPEQLFSWLTSSGSKIHGVQLVAGGPRVGYGLLASQVLGCSCTTPPDSMQYVCAACRHLHRHDLVPHTHALSSTLSQCYAA